MNSVAPAQFGFDFAESPAVSARPIYLPDGEALAFDAFFEKDESRRIFNRLHSETSWQQDYLTIYGKEVPLPRLTAWYGDKGSKYTYSNISMWPTGWTDLLLEIKTRVEGAANASFNSVLLNYYRSGSDGVSWHQDDETELGETPIIASASFGAMRTFQMKHLTNKRLPRVDIPLFDGSLLIMRGSTQKFWQHRIPKTTRPVGARINLTFRYIYT
jgi:alkylated DNA repair dioxygenase AlkB